MAYIRSTNTFLFLAKLNDTLYDKLVDPAGWPMINVGTGSDQTIRELAGIIADVVGYTGEFVQDTSKPDGTMRKVLEVSRMRELGWEAKTNLRAGIALAYTSFVETQL